MEFPILLGSFPKHILLDWLLLKHTQTRQGLEPHILPIMLIPGGSTWIWNWRTCAYWRMKVGAFGVRFHWKKGSFGVGSKKGGLFGVDSPKRGSFSVQKCNFKPKFEIHVPPPSPGYYASLDWSACLHLWQI